MRIALMLVTGCAVIVGVGCAGNGPAHDGGRLRVVAAESFWGNIASQIGGSRTDVRSIVVDPGVDPHSYQPTPSDARSLAESQLAILTGIGYDSWAPQTLAASPSPGRLVLSAGALLGLRAGDNPHVWYSPSAVHRMVGALLADLQRLDPAGASYYGARSRDFETRALAGFGRLRTRIRARFGGVRVGASESIFVPLARDLGLDLATPEGFMKAISEGGDVSASDKRAVDQQIAGRRIAVWVLNSQNERPDVARLTAAARAARIPVVAVTETLAPRGVSFQDWQTAQLRSLFGALNKATGR